MAESVDALDLKSNRGSPSVPVQVWPGALIIIKRVSFNQEALFVIISGIGFQDSLDGSFVVSLPNFRAIEACF